ncbi:MAG TPA: histidinol dehydrogenase [Opitutaceae bacterium]|nr:histidinol dehydrogenase [Opitutaceae bacterium]
MRTLSYSSKSFGADLAAFCREAAVPEEISNSVSSILASVRKGGDKAVAAYALKFDGAKLGPGDFRVTRAEISAAAKALPAADRKALKAVHAAVLEFNSKTLPSDWSSRNRHGARVGEKFDPIRRVGLYVPGGQVPLVSTVLMTATLAKVAGCPEVAVFTPSGRDGRIAPALLAALDIAGVSEVYRLGGVQAIGAMAYGTKTIRAVDKIFGPGNAYVCEAKRQVFGTVGVDLLPGPSEVMVIADDGARLDFAAADLLAQAEHGSGREKVYLVATSTAVISGIAAEMSRQLPGLSRSEKTLRVLEKGLLAVRVSNLSQAADIANRVAPEHLELLVAKAAARKLVKAITTAGAIMVGNSTPTALGDFAAGPSHVLPTGGAGRFSSGLRVADFLRRTSILEYDAASMRLAEPTVSALSAMEKLDAHGRSAQVRVERPRGK